ncbi:hypothetical protein QF019_000387 [Pseudomonas frederiksbergensis]|uniref:hypothetical protein n=1 Tax=Pseudomonas frederiksbergensis TaxID=104087 RepID=UPI003D23C3CC
MANAQQEQIERVTTMYNDAAHKLDYFILGVNLAICAYLAQTNPYGNVGFNKETFLLVSLVVFAASAACGLRRIESALFLMRTNVFILNQTDSEKRQEMYKHCLADKGPTYAKIRDILLFVGLFCYLATKVCATYQSNGWIPVH